MPGMHPRPDRLSYGRARELIGGRVPGMHPRPDRLSYGRARERGLRIDQHRDIVNLAEGIPIAAPGSLALRPRRVQLSTSRSIARTRPRAASKDAKDT